jgi:hypothetical protein
VASAKVNTVAMPSFGEHRYDLTGHSSLGPVPNQLRLGVAAADGGQQRWTLDASNPDGTGLVEELTVGHQADGVYLSAYHLTASGGLVGVDLKFSPAKPVLLLPDPPAAGRTWSFDLNSDDGCVTTHTVGTAPKAAAGTRHLRLVTTAKPTGKSGCVPIEATRTQDLWLPDGSSLPSRIDLDLSGKLGGTAPASASYSATLRQG